MDAATFRADFPEFANTTTFPNSSVNFWLGVAGKLLRPSRWLDMLDTGIELFAAHNLALEGLARQGAGANGTGIPGLNAGVVKSKQIDKLSISYDASIGIIAGAGHWNLTTYGTRFLWMMNMAGMGPTQVGAGAVGSNPGGEILIWGGPWGATWPYAPAY